MNKLFGYIFLLLGFLTGYNYIVLGALFIILSFIIIYNDINQNIKVKAIIGISLFIFIELCSNIMNFYGFYPDERISIAILYILILIVASIFLLKYVKTIVNNNF